MDDRLYRSVDDRMLAGVAGGVAERLDADPSIIRVVWALLVVLTGGLAFVAYLIMAVVVPEAPNDGRRIRPCGSPRPTRRRPGSRRAVRSGDAARSRRPDGRDRARWRPRGRGRRHVHVHPRRWCRRQLGRPGRTDRRACPEPTKSRRERSGADRGDDRGPLIGGLVLIVIGGFFLLRQFIPAIDLGSWWPLLLVGIGVISWS